MLNTTGLDLLDFSCPHLLIPLILFIFEPCSLRTFSLHFLRGFVTLD
jgi:hypothetical protein